MKNWPKIDKKSTIFDQLICTFSQTFMYPIRISKHFKAIHSFFNKVIMDIFGHVLLPVLNFSHHFIYRLFTSHIFTKTTLLSTSQGPSPNEALVVIWIFFWDEVNNSHLFNDTTLKSGWSQGLKNGIKSIFYKMDAKLDQEWTKKDKM